MDPPQEAKVAGISGSIVVEDGSTALWEVRGKAVNLGRLLSACQDGALLDVRAARGHFKALARQWWVLPVGADLVVRVALEKSASA